MSIAINVVIGIASILLADFAITEEPHWYVVDNLQRVIPTCLNWPPDNLRQPQDGCLV